MQTGLSINKMILTVPIISNGGGMKRLKIICSCGNYNYVHCHVWYFFLITEEERIWKLCQQILGNISCWPLTVRAPAE